MIVTVRPRGTKGSIALPDGTECTCAIGRGGVTASKREGDGATPIGRWPMRRVLYRPDRVQQPETALPVQPICENDGWCDDPASPEYNKPVRLPVAANHENMWRVDHLYDLVVILGYNDDPPRPGAGSAIFLHVARQDYAPTEGCVAMALSDLIAALRQLTPGAMLSIQDS